MNPRALAVAAILLLSSWTAGCLFMPGARDGAEAVSARTAWEHVEKAHPELVEEGGLVSVFAAVDRYHITLSTPELRPHYEAAVEPEAGLFVQWGFLFHLPEEDTFVLASTDRTRRPGADGYVNVATYTRESALLPGGVPLVHLIPGDPVPIEGDWIDSTKIAREAARLESGWDRQAQGFGALFILETPADAARPAWSLAAPAFAYSEPESDRYHEPPQRVVVAMDATDGSRLDPAQVYPPVAPEQQNETVLVAPDEGAAAFHVPGGYFGYIALAYPVAAAPGSNATGEVVLPDGEVLPMLWSDGMRYRVGWWPQEGEYVIRLETEHEAGIGVGVELYETAICWGHFPRDPLGLGHPPWSCGVSVIGLPVP